MRRPTRQLAVTVGVMATLMAVGAATVAWSADSGTVGNTVHETLTGYQEDPAVFSTTGNGQFQIHIDEAAQEISYELSYASLEGSVLQAHIHFGGQAQSGGISVFLCTNLGNGPAGTQLCPAAPATISGTIRPADVIGPASQGITAGQFGELLAAIRAGKTYANVHSTLYQGGEIRAQID
jgi:CHRD domain